MLLSSGQGWEQQKRTGKATALFFIPCFQLPHPTGSAWDTCMLEMGNPNLMCWNGIGQSGAKTMTCISARCIRSKFYFLSGLFLSTVFCQAKHPMFLLYITTVPYRACTLFLPQDAKVVAFPGRNQRYLIKVMTNGTNHAATAHCRRSRSTHQEPWTLELALSVLPTVGTEFIQYLPGKKNNLYKTNTNYK